MLYTVSEVAKMLKVNRNFVYNEIKKGNLEAVKIGSIKIRKDKWRFIISYKCTISTTCFSFFCF